MAQRRQRAALVANADHLAHIRAAVRGGRFRSASHFLREAIDEKLERLRREQLRAEVERYCREQDRAGDAELIARQAFDDEE